MGLIYTEIQLTNLLSPDSEPYTAKALVDTGALFDHGGYEAGRTGSALYDNPYPAGSPEHQAWDTGCRRGQDQAAKVAKPDAKKASTSRKRRDPQGDAAAA